MKILVTAGPTIEDIDPVRYLSNRSSGRMGYAVAQAAVDLGYQVTLVSGPTHLPCPQAVDTIFVRSAQEMLEAVEGQVNNHEIFILSAAVADYAPVEVLPQKRHKADDIWNLKLKKTGDILAMLGKIKHSHNIRALAGFCLESQAPVERARDKLKRKQADFILANDASVIDSEFFKGWLVSGSGERVDVWSEMTKKEAACRYVKVVTQYAQKTHDRY